MNRNCTVNRMACLSITTVAITTGAILVGCATDMSESGTGAVPTENIVNEKSPIPSAPEWTKTETAKFWASVARNATSITTAPRSWREADANKGEGILEAFGNRYMPNAYCNYEKIRDTAKEREQIFRENFPNGKNSDTSGGELYQKIGAATASAVSEYFRRRDELCHFYLLHKSGIMTSDDLAKLDEAPICTMLPAALSSVGELPNAPERLTIPDLKAMDFARKYRPETFAAYERQSALWGEGINNYVEMLADARILDAVRGGADLSILRDRLFALKASLDTMTKILKEEKLMHDVGERSAEQLANADVEFGIKALSFEKQISVKNFAKTWMSKNLTNRYYDMVAHDETPIFFLSHSMKPILERKFYLCKYEVTLGVWEAVMGYRPQHIPGYYHSEDAPSQIPVTVEFGKADRFIAKLNSLPEVRDSGRQYRLPTIEEMEMAVGGKLMGYKPMKDGTRVSANNLGEMAWYKGNSENTVHPVGLKKSNIYGLFDVLGNVEEWTSSVSKDYYNYTSGLDFHFETDWYFHDFLGNGRIYRSKYDETGCGIRLAW